MAQRCVMRPSEILIEGSSSPKLTVPISLYALLYYCTQFAFVLLEAGCRNVSWRKAERQRRAIITRLHHSFSVYVQTPPWCRTPKSLRTVPVYLVKYLMVLHSRKLEQEPSVTVSIGYNSQRSLFNVTRNSNQIASLTCTGHLELNQIQKDKMQYIC